MGSPHQAESFVGAGLTLGVTAGLNGLFAGIDRHNAQIAAARIQGARNASARRTATAAVGRDVATQLRLALATADQDCAALQRQIDAASADAGLRVIARRPALRAFTDDVGVLRAQVAAAQSELLVLQEELDDLLF